MADKTGDRDNKSRPGYTWVDDPRVKNGGYWRKIGKGVGMAAAGAVAAGAAIAGAAALQKKGVSGKDVVSSVQETAQSVFSGKEEKSESLARKVAAEFAVQFTSDFTFGLMGAVGNTAAKSQVPGLAAFAAQYTKPGKMFSEKLRNATEKHLGSRGFKSRKGKVLAGVAFKGAVPLAIGGAIATVAAKSGVNPGNIGNVYNAHRVATAASQASDIMSRRSAIDVPARRVDAEDMPVQGERNPWKFPDYANFAKEMESTPSIKAEYGRALAEAKKKFGDNPAALRQAETAIRGVLYFNWKTDK